VQIRKATLEDAAVSFAVRREAIRVQCQGHYSDDVLETWTAGEMSQTFANRVAERFYVATLDEQVVGTGMIDLGTGKIDAVFVQPEHMKQGIGRTLMAYLEQLALDAGHDSVQLESTLNAAPFYRALGFEGEGITTYQSTLGVSLDCVPMVKRLQKA